MSRRHPQPTAGVAGPPWARSALVLAAMLAGAWLALRHANPYQNPDSRAFEALARSLLAGRGLVYREPLLPGLDLYAFRSPGYAVFLAGLLGPGGVPMVLAAQGALAGLTALLWADLAARAAGARAALLVAAAALGLGLTWHLAGQLLSETLYGALLACGVRLAWSLAERARAGTAGGPWRAPALGAVIAAAVLTRPSGVALGAAAALLALARPETRRGLGAALLVALVLWSPWPIRNLRVLGVPVPSLTSGGINAWSGATGRPVSEGWSLAAGREDLGELGLDRWFWRLAAEEVRAHPAHALARLLHKAHDYAMPPSPRTGDWPHILLWGPALAAVVLSRRRDVPWIVMPGLPVVVWAGHAVVAVLTVVGERYRYPTDDLVLVLGGLGVDAILRRLGAPRGALALAATVGLGVLLAYTRHR